MQTKNKIDWDRLKKKIKHVVTVMGIAMFFSLVSIFFYRYYDYGILSSDYLKMNDIDELYKISDNDYLILNLDTYEHFQKECIGNDVSFLAQYGEIYSQDKLKCYSTDSKTIVNVDGVEKIICDSASSYFNVIENVICFRNDTDFKLYSYDVETSKLKCIVEEKVGQVTVSTKGITYISLADRRLNYKSLNDNSNMKLNDKKIMKYYVIGNKYLCLTMDLQLVLLDFNEYRVIDKDVENFVYNGNLIVQKGNKFYLYKTFKNIDEIVLKGNNQIQTLVDNKLYYVNYDDSKTTLKQYDLSTKSIKDIESMDNHTIIKGCYFLEKESILTFFGDTQLEEQ